MEPGSVAVVTGAASGIGWATVDLMVERGCSVVAVDRVSKGMAWPGAADRVATVVGDVADESTSEQMAAVARERFGRLDVAVLNAGIAGSPAFEAPGAVERLDEVLAVNVRGVVLGIRHVAPALRAAGGGAIVVTASTSGLGGDPQNWAYNASKAAVINLVRAAAIDYASQGIRVNAVAPGPVETAMTAGLRDLPEAHESLARRIPLQRWGHPRELAEAIWFLASPAASFITGVTLPVDGGLSSSAGHFDLPARPEM